MKKQLQSVNTPGACAPRQFSTDPGLQVKPSNQISVEIDQLFQQVENQEKLIAMLHERLRPIVRPADNEAPTPEPIMKENLVPLAEQLTRLRFRLNRHNELIDQLMSLIEV